MVNADRGPTRRRASKNEPGCGRSSGEGRIGDGEREPWMESTRFDELTRSLGTPVGRRRVLRSVAGLLGGGIGGRLSLDEAAAGQRRKGTKGPGKRCKSTSQCRTKKCINGRCDCWGGYNRCDSGKCCPTNNPTCCPAGSRNRCCGPNTVCCIVGSKTDCCPENTVCCPPGSSSDCCPSGTICSPSRCVPA